MQQSIPEPALTPSDLSPLNLNIWVPRVNGSLPAPGSLPVFAWVHGGGFISGSSAWPQYDMARLVRLSAEAGTPVIGMSFKYVHSPSPSSRTAFPGLAPLMKDLRSWGLWS